MYSRGRPSIEYTQRHIISLCPEARLTTGYIQRLGQALEACHLISFWIASPSRSSYYRTLLQVSMQILVLKASLRARKAN